MANYKIKKLTSDFDHWTGSLPTGIKLIFTHPETKVTYWFTREELQSGLVKQDNLPDLLPHVGENGNWFFGITDTGVKAQATDGNNGITPHIGVNGNWFVGTNDTGVKAQATDGNDGITPHIGVNGNWFIGTNDTGVKAQGGNGNDGITPHIGGNGNWFIGTTDTGIKAQGTNGTTTETIGYALSDQTTDITTGVKVTDRMPYAFTLTDIRGSLQTAATGGTFTVNIKKNGVTIFSTKLTFDSGEASTATAAIPFALSSNVFASDDIIEFSVDAVGSVTPGKGLIVKLIGNK